MSVERNVEVTVVADKKMVDYYSNEDINTYILTVMNMVCALFSCFFFLSFFPFFLLWFVCLFLCMCACMNKACMFFFVLTELYIFTIRVFIASKMQGREGKKIIKYCIAQTRCFIHGISVVIFFFFISVQVSSVYRDASLGNAVNMYVVRIMLLEDPQYEVSVRGISGQNPRHR